MMRYGKDGGLPKSCRNQVKHEGGFTRVSKTCKFEESQKMRGKELTIIVEKAKVNGERPVTEER